MWLWSLLASVDAGAVFSELHSVLLSKMGGINSGLVR